MIQVKEIIKYYGPNRAIENISLSVEKGEILGILGPNGAGKSTLFRILCGYIPATSGEVHIDGMDVFRDSLQVRRLIGYMPESVPLYTDMRVIEYLDYRARLKDIPRNLRKQRLELVMEQCSIGDVRRRIIGQLSKGYRQRVGLAAALVHNPPLLILDEPTIGLDPNQIRDIRQLIKSLAGEHTVLLASHILPEVENTCSRVTIIDKGKVVAMDSTANLRTKYLGDWRSLYLEVKGDIKKVLQMLEKITKPEKIHYPEDGPKLCLTIENEAGEDFREKVFQAVCSAGAVILEMRPMKNSLEDVFVRLTAQSDETAAAGAEDNQN